jgi:ribosomal-protein-alanine N-acetyltransferase
VIVHHDVRFALPAHAAGIAEMSRDFIEHGLGWRWTEARVLRNIHDKATNVAVVHEEGQLFGFGIMKYGDESAHLFLLAVHFLRRRRGVGTAMLSWLETSARTAGIERIRVEARVGNTAARAFYQSRGYNEVGKIPGYYRELEDAIRFEKSLTRL